jgi:hypothetical protein
MRSGLCVCCDNTQDARGFYVRSYKSELNKTAAMVNVCVVNVCVCASGREIGRRIVVCDDCTRVQLCPVTCVLV